MALGVAKADDEETMRNFAAIVSNIVDFELPKNRELLATVREMEPTASEEVEMAPATLAYTRHLLTVAYEGRAADIMASLTPCAWSYGEIGKERLPDAPITPSIATGSSSSVVASTGTPLDEIKDKLEGLCDGLGDAAMARIHVIFQTSSRLERSFWDMAYNERSWPV